LLALVGYIRHSYPKSLHLLETVDAVGNVSLPHSLGLSHDLIENLLLTEVHFLIQSYQGPRSLIRRLKLINLYSLLPPAVSITDGMLVITEHIPFLPCKLFEIVEIPLQRQNDHFQHRIVQILKQIPLF